ncbi:MAG: T9SS type A sorting domain-containing protein [Ignavibacteriaceae bacterium]
MKIILRFNCSFILLTAFLFLLNTFVIKNSLAQELPLVYDAENTGADCPIPYLPAFSELTTITKSLPDPFEWIDGRGRMKNFSDWRIRRAEIGAQIANYEIGPKPTRPDDITASYSNGVLTVNVTVNNHTLTLTSQVILPAGTSPFPAVIGMNSPSGSIPSNIFSDRNIAEIRFSHNQVTTYGNPSTANPYYQLYPNLNPTNTGQYSAWAWGVSRIIDGLELVQNVLPIDLKHIAVTGCSYAGKMALFAGAFDERIALTIAQESGGGGATSWRYSHSEPAGSVELIDNTDYNWFMNSMAQFSGDNVWKLPEDHHELMAMCAPRALLVTANPDYIWLSNPSCDVCSRAAKEVYNTLGISDRFGFSVVGGHSHCAVPNSQIPEIEAFVDKFLLGKDTVNTDSISDSPYNIDLAPWITWTNPVLQNDTTFYTSLVYPSNLQVGLDTNITFKWKSITASEKYYFELSKDQTFDSIYVSDSTTTDTSKTFTGLLKNQRYYWRIKVKSTSDSGPWSNIFSFVTTLSEPAAPKLVSSVSDKTGYITFTWNSVENTERYTIQVAVNQSFTNIFKSASITDTSNSIGWFREGIPYYWRIQASNLAGSGLWSDTGNITVIYLPSDLALQSSAANEITLTWKNNSTIEEGNIIERKQGPEGSFAVIDTLKGTGNEFVDKNVEAGQNYIYRIKAYKDSLESEYSNEASFLVDVKSEAGKIPTEYSISQNFPNPFNPATKIKFGLPKAGLTRITVYDLLGRDIMTLINNELKAGYHEVNFDAHNLPSGIYLYKIQSGEFTQTKKMILMK